MIPRLVHIVFFVFFLGVFVSLLSHVDNRKLFLTSTPTSEDQGQHGLSNLNWLITNAGLKTSVIRSNYQTLDDHAENNILFLSLPAAIPASRAELESLARWVSRGNHIVASLALDDAPHWMNKQNRFSIETFLSTFDLQLTRLDTGKEDTTESTKQPYLVTQLLHPVTRHIKRIKTSETSQGHVWQLRGVATPRSSLILLREASSLSPVAWLSLFGKGKLYIFTHSDLFANANIGTSDNMQLAKNIIDYSLGTPASIYFDDSHHVTSVNTHGMGPFFHPQLLMLAGILIYILLIFILNRSQQQTQSTRLSLNQLIHDRGKQLSRSLSRSDAAIRYADFFFKHVRRRLDLPPNKQPVWAELSRQKLNKRHLARSQQAYQNATSDKKINLHRFIRRLEKLRSQLK